MAKNTVDIKAGRLFPFRFIVLGGVFFFAGVLVVVEHPIGGGVLIFLSLLILTAYEGTQIDLRGRAVREYYSFFFIKTGGAKGFRAIEGISIHSAKVTQKMFTPRTMSSSTFSHIEYNAYLKLSGDDKIFLFGHKNKPKVLGRAREVAARLGTTVVDHAVR